MLFTRPSINQETMKLFLVVIECIATFDLEIENEWVMKWWIVLMMKAPMAIWLFEKLQVFDGVVSLLDGFLYVLNPNPAHKYTYSYVHPPKT